VGRQANYVDVVVWGVQGENVARYLTKGRPIAIDGRLEWREYDAQDGSKRQAVQIIADAVQFLSTAERMAVGQGPHAARSTDDDIPF
jgi:single-strand DNA-binding protein